MMRLGNYKHRASHRIEHRLWSAISCHLRSQIEKKSHLGVLPGPEKHDHRTRRKAIDRMTHFFTGALWDLKNPQSKSDIALDD
jgi:hypothetical protein